MRSILEYGSPVFYRTLPSYLSEDLERLGRAMKIIYPELSYVKALELSRLLTLYDRRGGQLRQSCSMKYVLINLTVSTNYFQENTSQATLWENKEHLFHGPNGKTERCKNSFLLSYVYELDIILFLIVYRNLTHAFKFVIL